jgi:hypothetical protein
MLNPGSDPTIVTSETKMIDLAMLDEHQLPINYRTAFQTGIWDPSLSLEQVVEDPSAHHQEVMNTTSEVSPSWASLMTNTTKRPRAGDLDDLLGEPTQVSDIPTHGKRRKY